MFKTLKKLFDNEYKELYRFSKLADQIDALDEEMSKLSDKKLASYTDKFKKRLEDGETLDDILVEAFAVAREAAYRCLGMKPFYCQLLGGLAIHYGNIAEMKTGEGKTLTCVLPAYLNALTGKGVHIVTVNEFLSTRDSEWMGSIFKFLGLTVGLNLRELSFKENLNMTIIDANYNFDKSQLIFRFLADERIDFRKLAKDLASNLKTRIELRQIGVRDKAKEIGGIGPCGRILCCSSFLTNFESVSINMAKNQGIALNPTKINGVCGRLLCCLNYENEQYMEVRKNIPDVGKKVKINGKEGKVISSEPLAGKYKVFVDNEIVQVDVNDSKE